jgi:hypothetical protein
VDVLFDAHKTGVDQGTVTTILPMLSPRNSRDSDDATAVVATRPPERGGRGRAATRGPGQRDLGTADTVPSGPLNPPLEGWNQP